MERWVPGDFSLIWTSRLLSAPWALLAHASHSFRIILKSNFIECTLPGARPRLEHFADMVWLSALRTGGLLSQEGLTAQVTFGVSAGVLRWEVPSVLGEQPGGQRGWRGGGGEVPEKRLLKPCRQQQRLRGHVWKLADVLVEAGGVSERSTRKEADAGTGRSPVGPFGGSPGLSLDQLSWEPPLGIKVEG